MIIYAIIVTYNGANWIEKCLQSLRSSDIKVQTIVVDNESTDSTVAIIKEKFPEVLLLDAGGNLGFGKANNLGILKALELKAEYILLLNQDAWIDNNVLSDLINIHLQNLHFGVLSPIHLNGSGDALDGNFSFSINSVNCPQLLSDLLADNLKEIYSIKFVMAAIWLLPREVFLRVGLFDPMFPHYGEDVDYIQRLKYHGYQVGISPNHFGYHDRENRAPSDKRTRTMRYLGYLCMIKDLNNNLIASFLTFQFQWLKDSVKLIFKGKIIEFFYNIIDAVKIILLLPKVLLSRKYFKNHANKI